MKNSRVDKRHTPSVEMQTDLRRMRALVDTYTARLIEVASDRDDAARMLRERLRAIEELRFSIDPAVYSLIDGPDLLRTSAQVLSYKPSFKARSLAILIELNGTPISASKLKLKIEQEGGKKFAKTIASTTISRLVASGKVLKTPDGYIIATNSDEEMRSVATVQEIKSYIRSLLIKHGPLTISIIHDLLRKDIVVPGEHPETNIHTILSKDLKNFVRIRPSTYSLPEIEGLDERPTRQNKHVRMRGASSRGNEP